MPFPEHAIIDEVGVLVGEYEQFLSGKAQGTRHAYLRTVRHLIGWLTQHPGHTEPFQPQQLTRTVVELYLAHLEQEQHAHARLWTLAPRSRARGKPYV